MILYLKSCSSSTFPVMVITERTLAIRTLRNTVLYTLRKVLPDFAVYDVWGYCKALCGVKLSQIEGTGRKFSHIRRAKCISERHQWNISINIFKARYFSYTTTQQHNLELIFGNYSILSMTARKHCEVLMKVSHTYSF